MKKLWFVVPAFLVLAAAMLAPACASADARVNPGQEFQLKVGDKVSVNGKDLAIEFVRVTQDSRCPTGAQCIQAGKADCDVYLTTGGSIYLVTLSELGGSTQAEADNLGYHFVFNVLPYPEVGKDIRYEDYTLVLKVIQTG